MLLFLWVVLVFVDGFCCVLILPDCAEDGELGHPLWEFWEKTPSVAGRHLPRPPKKSPGEEMGLGLSGGFVDRPVVGEAGVEAEVFHVLDGVGGHLGAAVWIEREFDECVGPCFLIFDGEDESGFVFWAVVVDDFLWTSLICCDDGDS